MPRPKDEDDLQKHTLMLYKGDFARLGSLFPDISPSLLVRKLVRDAIKKVEGNGKTPKVRMDI